LNINLSKILCIQLFNSINDFPVHETLRHTAVIKVTYLSVGSVASLRSTVDDGMPSTWSMMCMIPFVAAKLAWTTVAFTPPPSRVNVRFLPLVTTLKNRSLRGTSVWTWKRWSIVDGKKNQTKQKWKSCTLMLLHNKINTT